MIIKTDTPFATLENPEFEVFCSYFAQCDVALPSTNIFQCGLLKKFDDEKVKTRKLFQPIKKVSLTMDTWTTPNRLAILGVTIHWIDDMWNLHERVLSIEELRESHGGAHMAKVSHEILIDYNLIDKVKFFCIFELYFLLHSFFPFFKVCAITTDNASNNCTMTEDLEKLLKGSSSRFAKNYLMPCMAHVLNLAIQRGLKELGNDDSYSDSEDDEKHVEGLEVISQRPFGEILHSLRKLIIVVNHSPKRMC